MGLSAHGFQAQTSRRDLQRQFFLAPFTGASICFFSEFSFRPGLSAARLVKLDDADAWDVYWRLSAVIVSIIGLRIVSRVLIAIKTPPEAISAWQMLTSLLVLSLLLWAAWTSRGPVASWFSSMIDTAKVGALESAFARNWLFIAVPFFVVLWITQLHGAITQHFAAATALLLTLNLLIALILFETLLQFVERRLSTPGVGLVATGKAPGGGRCWALHSSWRLHRRRCDRRGDLDR